MLLSSHIDHTLLRPDAQRRDIEQLCADAIAYGFAAVCVSPYFAKICVDLLRPHRQIKVASVVGFPLGYTPTSSKVAEIIRLIDDEIDEIDAVVHIAAVKNSDWKWVRKDLQSMVIAAHENSKVIKIIFETGLLVTDELVELCQICNELGVDYAKTSTGMLGAGASREIVALMRQNLLPQIKIKASGGIRTRAEATALILAGANRIGTSNGVNMILEK